MADLRTDLINRWTQRRANKQAVCLGCDATIPSARDWSKASLLIRRQRANREVEFWQRAIALVAKGPMKQALAASEALRDHHGERADECEGEFDGASLVRWSQQTLGCQHRQYRDLWEQVREEIAEALETEMKAHETEEVADGR